MTRLLAASRQGSRAVLLDTSSPVRMTASVDSFREAEDLSRAITFIECPLSTLRNPPSGLVVQVICRSQQLRSLHYHILSQLSTPPAAAGRENLSPNFETSRLGTLSAVQKCTSLKHAAREVRAFEVKTCDGHAEFGRLSWSDGVFRFAAQGALGTEWAELRCRSGSEVVTQPKG